MAGQDNVKHNEFDKNKAIATAKDILHDRALSAAKDEVISDSLTYGVTGAGMLYGLKKELAGKRWSGLSSSQKSKILKNTALNRALPVFAVTGILADAAVPVYRLHKLHRKEFGTEPEVKDYAKLVAVKGLPSAAYYGALYKNRAKLADGIGDMIKSAPKLISKSTKFPERKKAFKTIAAGAAAGGAVSLLDEATGVTQLMTTPETIIKAKKRNQNSKGVKNNMEMELKQAFEVIDSAFDKIASEQEEDFVIDKTAEEIVEYGFQKIASKQSMLHGIGDVLTGKNIQKAKSVMNAAESAPKAVGGAGRVIDAVDNKIGDLANSRAQKVEGMTKDLSDKLSKNQSNIGANARNLKDNQKSIQKIKEGLDKARKPVQSDRTGRWGDVENTLRKKTYEKNRTYNDKIDNIIDRMNSGRTIDNHDLGVTKGTMFGGKRFVPNTDFNSEIKQYNVANSELHGAKKQMNRSKANAGVLKKDIEAKKGTPEYAKAQQAAEDAKKLSGISSSTKKLKDTFTDLQNAAGVNIGESAAEKARSNYNKEVAKTVGTYGAIGGGALLGAKALSGKSDNTSQPQAPSSQQFVPKYNFNRSYGA
jgi:hypothetical protein